MAEKILIIDDAIHMRRLIARMLEREQFEILEAANGQQGLQLLRAHKPAVVTCDISMPVMDGYKFLAAAKSDPELADIPVIIITAVGQAEGTVEVMESGADACLTKPFSSTHFLEVVDQLLNKALV